MKNFFLFIFIILYVFVSNDEEDDKKAEYDLQLDTKACAETSYNDCQKAPITTAGRICCQISETTADNVAVTCELKTTKEDQEKLVGSSISINKELGGLAMYNVKYGGVAGNLEERTKQLHREISINCYSWDFFVSILDEHDYTNDDIKILQSDTHCLTYFNPLLIRTSLNQRDADRKACFEASLLSSTKNEGLSCGYMEIKIEEPGAVETKKTCFLYDPKVVKNGILDEATKGNLNSLTGKNTNDNINYVFTIYASNNEGYTYDSKTGEVTKTVDTYNGDCRISKMVFLNYFLVIILLFL